MTHDITSGTISFTGGSTPSLFAGYALNCPTIPRLWRGLGREEHGRRRFSVRLAQASQAPERLLAGDGS